MGKWEGRNIQVGQAQGDLKAVRLQPSDMWESGCGGLNMFGPGSGTNWRCGLI